MYANHMATLTVGENSAAAANAVAAVKEALGKSLGEPGTDPSPLLPEPRGLKALLRALLHAQQAWGKAVKKEAKSLICDMNSWQARESDPSYAHTKMQDQQV